MRFQGNLAVWLRVVLLVQLCCISTVLLGESIAVLPAYAENSALLSPAEGLNGSSLRIDGSEEMSGINQLLKQGYEKQFPGGEISLRANGTTAALEKLQQGKIDVAAIGRALTAEEKAQGLLAIAISREPIAIIVGQENPFQGALTPKQVAQIFRGEVTDWAEVGGPAGAIRVIDRPATSDSYLALHRQLVRGAEPFPGLLELAEDDTTAVIQALGSDGISYGMASQLTRQTQARTLPLVLPQAGQPIDPMDFSALYPYSQVRGYAYKTAPNDAVQAFLGFVTTKPGQTLVATAKATEAKAVAAGESIAPIAVQPIELQPIEPVGQPEVAIAEIAPPIAAEQPNAVKNTEDRSDSIARARFVWLGLLILPIALIGLGWRWFNKRRLSKLAKGEQSANTETSTASSPVGAIKSVDAAALNRSTQPKIAERLSDNADFDAIFESDDDEWGEEATDPEMPVSAGFATPDDLLRDEAIETTSVPVTAVLAEEEIDTELIVEVEAFDESVDDEPTAELIAEPIVETSADSGDVELIIDAEVLDELIDDELVTLSIAKLESADELNVSEPIATESVEVEADEAEITTVTWTAVTEEVITIEELEALDTVTEIAESFAEQEVPVADEVAAVPWAAVTEEVITIEELEALDAAAEISESSSPVESVAAEPEFDRASEIVPEAVLEAEPEVVIAIESLPEADVETTEMTEVVVPIEAAIAMLTDAEEEALVEPEIEAETPIADDALIADVADSGSEEITDGAIATQVEDSDQLVPEEIADVALEAATDESIADDAGIIDELELNQLAGDEQTEIVNELAAEDQAEITDELEFSGETKTDSQEIENGSAVVEMSIAPELSTDSLDEQQKDQFVNLDVSWIEPIEEISQEPAFPLRSAFLEAISRQGYAPETVTPQVSYQVMASLLCEHLLSLHTPEVTLQNSNARLIGELAIDFTPGPALENALVNLGLGDEADRLLQECGLNLAQLLNQETEPGLGQSELGQLMICNLDSLATANRSAVGYGIRYESGWFVQDIRDGWQVEVADAGLQNRHLWELERPEQAVTVAFGGSTTAYIDQQRRYRVRWIAAETVQAIPCDRPIPGYRTPIVNWLRLWKPSNAAYLGQKFEAGDLHQPDQGLRLKQQFFLLTCALQDVVRLHLQAGQPIEALADRFALQLNDQETALAVAELMRLLVDEQGLDWEPAWEITQRTLSYTNHRSISETREDLWSIALLEQLLPRHLEIIYEINYRWLEQIKAQFPGDESRLNRLSLIEEWGDRSLRLNFLAWVGCHAVNGVTPMQAEKLKQSLFQDFIDLQPQKFSSQFYGITPRRFLLQTHPALAALISRSIGRAWITHPELLQKLEPWANNAAFCQEWQQTKQVAKQHLATILLQQTGLAVDSASLFDMQAMSIQDAKRQVLNLLHILTLYNRLKANPNIEMTPRTFFFAGQAQPDDFTAKLTIKLIHAVAAMVNRDADLAGRLRVVFCKNFNLQSIQPLAAAVDLTESIALAGAEVTATASLIFALNGACLIGTPTGSNLELLAAIGADHSFQFGLTLEQLQQQRSRGYHPIELYQANPELMAAIDLLTSVDLSPDDPERFRPLVNLLLYYDQYRVLADYAAYLACQAQVSQAFQDRNAWTRHTILTTARIGQFSSDRTVADYWRSIWQPTTLGV